MKIFWKLYAIIYLLLVAILLSSYFSDQSLKIIDYVDIAISLPTIIAVVGWAWKKAVGTPAFWFIYVIAFFIFDIIYNVFFDESNNDLPIFELVFGLIILLPSYIATLMYSLNFEAIRLRSDSKNLTSSDKHSSPSKPEIVWSSQPAETRSDPQLQEIRQQQTVSAANQNIAESLTQAVQESYDAKIEKTQLGKWPWERWYDHPVLGRDPAKGIADITFLSLFGSSSSTDRNYSKGQRALIRTVITLAVLAAFSFLI